MSGARHWEQDKEATVYIGNLDERVGDSLVWELMLQAGRIVNVHLPKDRVSQSHQGYGFVEFISEEDAEYAARIMNQVRLYGKPIRVNKASADKQKVAEVGAELFVGNLDPMVDEKTLYETFSRFGSLIAAPKIARDDAGLSKGFGFVSFSNFEASDDAIANMNAQYLMNKEISVQYAFKKDGKGERHGDQAERMLAAQAKKHNVQPQAQQLPPQLFNNVPPPQAPVALLDGGDPNRGMGAPPVGNMGGMPPAGYMTGGGPGAGARPTVPNGGYPPPHGGAPPRGGPPPPSQPLPAPPSGLPARPPPSVGGYNGPQGFQGPGGFNNAPPPPGGFAQHGGPPAGLPAPPPGFGPPPGQQMGMPPGMPPPGFGPPPGQLPPGFQQQQQGYGRGR